MSRNGSGTYNLPAGNPVVTGTTISSTWANNTMNDLAAALTGSVAADGQTPMTGDLNLNNNKIVNVDDPTQAQDAATKTYVDAKTDGTSAGAFTTLTASDDVNFDSGTFFVDAFADKVGIGTTTPSVQLETSFDFSGQSSVNAVNLGGTDTGIGFTGIKVAYKDATDLTNATSFPLQVFTDNAAQLTVTGSGSVGIGTFSPSSQLETDFNFLNLSNVTAVILGGTDTGVGFTGIKVAQKDSSGLGSPTSFPLQVFTDNTQQLCVTGTGELKFDSGYGLAATAYGCRAWVNFNGTGTVSIRTSGNVSSITDDGTGNYTVNFSTAMPDTNYAVASSVGNNINNNIQGATRTGTFATSSFKIGTVNAGGTQFVDDSVITCTVFR